MKKTDMIAEMSRRNALRLMALTGAAGVFAPALLGRGAAAQGTAPKGRIIVGVSQEPVNLNPLMPKNEVDDNVHFSIFDPLFFTDPEGKVLPRLAVEVPSQENGGISADGLEWRVKLRDDVKWHDGAPFTAEDVKFTLELIVDPDFRAWRTAGHKLVRDITVVSPTEITWRMEKPFSPYLSFLTETFIIPKHAFDGVTDPNEAPFNLAPIGTGPFKLANRVAGDHIELAANIDYFSEGPFVEMLVFKYIPDLTVLYTQFKSGDIDITGRQYITPDNYEEAKTLPDRTVVLAPAPSVETIYFNLEKPQFKELVVRQAIYAAIDKEAIIDALYYGVPVPTESYMSPRSFFFNPALPKQEFSIEAANKLLDDAGWVPGADGIREKDGVRLSFTNSTTAGNHLREQAQQFIQQTLREAGIEMKIENLPAAVIWGEFWTMSQFDSVIVGLVFTIGADPDVTDRLHSGSIPAQGGTGANQAQFRNDEVDKLLEEGTQVFDPEQRRQIYFRVQEIVREELPFLPMFSGNEIRGWKSGIEGIVPNPNNRAEAWDSNQWHWVG